MLPIILPIAFCIMLLIFLQHYRVYSMLTLFHVWLYISNISITRSMRIHH